jgi:hypothetical protein
VKLYLCRALAIDDDPIGLVVAENENEAEKNFRSELDDEGIWYTGTISVEEVSIEGYEILIRKVDKS